MENEIGLFEAKTKLSEICGKVRESGVEYVITRRGKPVARLVPHDPAERNALSALPLTEALEQWDARHVSTPTEKESDFPDVWLERRGAKPDPIGYAET